MCFPAVTVIAGPVLELAYDMALYVTTVPLIGTEVVLIVYRSINVRPGIKGFFNEVEDFLSKHAHELLEEVTQRDECMYGLRAVLSTYLVQGARA